jgi:hypothetical protein
MKCIECQRMGKERDAVALCRECLAGLCATHLGEMSGVVLAREPLFKEVELPLRTRYFLCDTCSAALKQPGETKGQAEIGHHFPVDRERLSRYA